jgi:hypothetical protein
MFMSLQAAASCSGGWLAFRAFQAALYSVFAARLRAPETRERLAESASGDVPEPDARHALVGEANPADALPAFEHAIIANADRAELQHIPAGFSRARPNAQRRPSAEYVGPSDVGYVPGKFSNPPAPQG